MGGGLVASSVRKDKCVRFSGTGYVTMGAASAYDFERTDSFSIYLWARWTSTGTQHLIARVGNAAANRGWSVIVQSTAIRFSHKSSGPADPGGSNRLVVQTSSSGWNDGNWHSIIVTYAGTSAPSGCHIYLDNNDEALTTVENTLSATTKGTFDMAAGRDIVQSAFQYGGDIGGLAIFNSVISSSDRAVLHNSRKGPPKPADVLTLSNLLGFWRMGNGNTYPTTEDEVGSDDGTLTSLSAAAMQTYAPPYSS